MGKDNFSSKKRGNSSLKHEPLLLQIEQHGKTWGSKGPKKNKKQHLGFKR